MFSVYGTAGRLFRGSMEELRKIGPTSALMRTGKLAPIGQDAAPEPHVRFADALAASPQDHGHRSAMAAYAQTAKIDHPRHTLTRVQDIMSSTVVVLRVASSVGDAWRVLAERQLGQAPVVDEAGMLVGMLSRADLLRPDRLPGPDTHALVWKALLMQSVADLMWTPVPSAAPATDIRRLARVLLDTGLPGLPVADEDGRVTGFVSRSDILRAVVADPPLDLWT